MKKNTYDRTLKNSREALESLFDGGEIIKMDISRDRFISAYIRKGNLIYYVKFDRADHIEFTKRHNNDRSLYSVWTEVFVDSPVFDDNRPIATHLVDVPIDKSTGEVLDIFASDDISEYLSNSISGAKEKAVENIDKIQEDIYKALDSI